MYKTESDLLPAPAPPPGELRCLHVLLYGFDSDLLQQLRRHAAGFPNVELRLYSRRRSDFSTPSAGAVGYDVALINAAELPADANELGGELSSLLSQLAVVLAGAEAHAGQVELLERAGSVSVLLEPHHRPRDLLAAAVQAASLRVGDTRQHQQKLALHSLALSLGQAPPDDEPILLLGEDQRLSYANRAAQALGSNTVAQLIEQVLQQQESAQGLLISRLQAGDGAQRRDFTVTATRLPAQTSYTLVRLRVHGEPTAPRRAAQAPQALDATTELPSRDSFLQQAEQLLASQPEGTGLLLIELDQMQGIQEALGQDTVTGLLNLAGQRMRLHLQGGDWMGYLGNHQFAVLTQAAGDSVGLSGIADGLRREVAAPVQLDGRRIGLTASVGIAAYPGDGEQAGELLHHAGLALARARARGGDAHDFFDHSLGAQLRHRWELQMALQMALEREEFWLAYQPVISAASGSICGAEALLRWQHPTLGLQSPADFVPVLEQCGLIHRVGEWVLREACRQAQRWRETGASDFRISVNVSPLQLRDARLPERIAKALEDSGLPPQALVLELTENVLLERTEEIAQMLASFGRLGVGLHIDDFGTGFSSLSYLKRLPFTGIKVDRSFITDIAHDLRDQALVRWMVELARIFDLDVVAEGIENSGDADTVQSMGVNKLQGFLFSPGVPAQEFERQLMQSHAD